MVGPSRISVYCGLLLVFFAIGILTLAFVPITASDTSDIDGVSTQLETTTDSVGIEPCAEEMPDDYAPPDGETSDVIGWVDGYWYDQPIDFESNNGLTEEDLEALSARTAARFEVLRCLTIDEIPPVEIITRDEFREQLENQTVNISDSEAAFQNAFYQTLLMIGEEDALEIQQDQRSAVVGGYYSIVDSQITIITNDVEALPVNERILAHELGHAIQDQQFNLSQYVRYPHDRDMGLLGVVEGDVHRIEHEYLTMCVEEYWSEPCMIDDSVGNASGNGQPLPSWGMYFMDFQPYSDGPNFINHIYETGGWEAVNALYDDIPQTSTEIIVPERYGEFAQESLHISDASNTKWERTQPRNNIEYERVGQAGLSAMFMGHTYEKSGAGTLLSLSDILNTGDDGTIDAQNPLEYHHEITDGWRGDKLIGYQNEAGEPAAVWKIAWESAADAEDFAVAYTSLVESYGGVENEDYGSIYTFSSDSSFDMAVSVTTDGDRVWIVTAPTVEALTEVRSETPFEEQPTPDETLPSLEVFLIVFTLIAVGTIAIIGRTLSEE